MKVQGKHYRAIWVKENSRNKVVQVIDQRNLPFEFNIIDLKCVSDMAIAIQDMKIRGAPLIGVCAAYGVYLGALEGFEKGIREADFDDYLLDLGNILKESRPTAVNLAWAVDEMLKTAKNKKNVEEKVNALLEEANKIAEDEVENCKKIGNFGVSLIEEISKKKRGEVVNVLTHCNAGWPACVDYGTATAPIYEAFERGVKIHVWVDETRPRGQGARITAWELNEHGVPHTVIADNTGGYLMQHQMVDLVIVGSDRTTYTGDVGNKIGTYLKALAAKDNNIPFYVALPVSTFDWEIRDGVKEIPIEERDEDEVKYMQGLHEGEVKKILLTPLGSPAKNYGFDVTPARLISGLITERGICEATEEGILSLFPEKR